MNLEHELRALPIAFPAEPNLRGAVLARIDARPRRRLWPVALLATLATVAALLAIPQTRAAIVRLLEVGGIRIERVETQPSGERSAFVGGRRVTLRAAAAAVDFRLAAPPRGSTVYLDRGVPGGMVSYVWDGYVLSQWRGAQTTFAQKQIGPGGNWREVDVVDGSGIWITGAQHNTVFLDRNGRPREQTRRLAGNVLIWERGMLTYRLEGAKTLDEAVALARNLSVP